MYGSDGDCRIIRENILHLIYNQFYNAMRFIYLFLTLFLSNILSAQYLELSDSELSRKLDSVLIEANTMYRYERASWISTDYVMADSELKNKFGGYLTYEESGLFKAIALDKKSENCISEYVFMSDLGQPDGIITKGRALTSYEINLLNIKNKIISQLGDPKYELSVPDGFSLNLILMPNEKEYKLYIITGTAQSNVIPFGNDYLFVTDSEGNIESWKKFHSRLIPAQTIGPDGEKVVGLVHSHLRTNPLISATDICTFKLYAPLYGLEEFSVYSPAIKKYMKYNLKTDKITTDE